MNHPKQHKTLWTVLFSGGHFVRYDNLEDAKADAFLYGGTGIVPPLYQ